MAALFAGVIGLFAISASWYELKYTGTQGRYLFPGDFAIAALLLVGLTGWMPPSWRPRVTAVAVAGAGVFSTWVLFHEFIGRVT
jgi:hypothetical protein